MFSVLQIATTLFVAVAMALSLAHALELPGKRRLSKDDYLVVQHIYYPGFTIGGGIGEAGGFLLGLALLFLTPRESTAFWLTLVGLIGLGGMQIVYWVFTHPINQYWLQGDKLKSFGSAFFSFTPTGRSHPETEAREGAWMRLRDRWEYSHVARAGLGLLSFTALVVALKS
jgi:hypothetical protein